MQPRENVDEKTLVELARKRAIERARTRKQQLIEEQKRREAEAQSKRDEQWRKRDQRIRAFLLRQVEDGRAPAELEDSFAVGTAANADDSMQQDRTAAVKGLVGTLRNAHRQQPRSAAPDQQPKRKAPPRDASANGHAARGAAELPPSRETSSRAARPDSDYSSVKSWGDIMDATGTGSGKGGQNSGRPTIPKHRAGRPSAAVAMPALGSSWKRRI